jgi:dihydrofolate synthase/folylpolyglutamate synthase
MLADKDAGGVLAALAPHVDRAIATQSASSRARPAADLAERARGAGIDAAVERDAVAALVRARAEAGRDGVVLVTGSLSLLADLTAGQAAGGGVRWLA